MKLSMSVISRDRAFLKAMRRTRERLQPLIVAFGQVVMVDPIHESILVGITSEEGEGYFREIDNDEGVFQVLAGCVVPTDDETLVHVVYDILRRAVLACPFSEPDRKQFENVFYDHRPTVEH